MKRKASVSHDEWVIEELRADSKLAAAYLALRRLAEAHGGMAAVAMEAGIQRESLYRALSPKANPTMNTLIAVFKSRGMRLTVEPNKKAA